MTKIHHFSSYGKRQEKYDLLNNTDFQDVPWQELELKEPYYFFVPKDFGLKEKYDKGFSISEIFKEFNSGIQTKRDALTIQFDESKLLKIKEDFINLDTEEIRKKYNLPVDGRDWTIDFARKDLLNNNPIKIKYNYRPFDIKNSFYTGKSKGFIAYPRDKQSIHMINNNLSLITCRNQDFQTLGFVSKYVSDMRTFSNPGSMGTDYFFPLYLYNSQNSNISLPLGEVEGGLKTPNFNPEIIAKIEEKLGMRLIDSESSSEGQGEGFTPENLFDYIYAVLHSKTYRENYKEFLKIDFPKIPFDCDKEIFFKLAKLGEELRSYHLLENPNLIKDNSIANYGVDGDNLVEKVKYEKTPPKSTLTEGEVNLSEDEELGKIFINETQYFSGVPKKVWEFYIGGYQPAQKWLKDRKDRKLDYEDIIHYRKIISSILETIRIMDEIEKILFL